MATGVDLSVKLCENFDNLLTCTICLETFKEPKLLKCLHTFCKSCVHTYVDSFNRKNEMIPCPLCRNPISSVNGSDDVDTIVNNLPANKFVVSLLDKKTITERKCNHCNFQGKQNKAELWCGVCEEFFCDQCVKYHRTNKLLANHKVIAIEDIQNETANLNETTVVFCDEHRESVVQVYCVDHKKVCCTLCATLSHRKCDKVISMEEAAAGIKQNGGVTELISKLEELEKVLVDVISRRNENEETFETETSNIENAVTKIIKEMKDHLDKIQNKILSELESAKKQTSMKVTDDINDFTSYKSAVTNWKNMLAGVVQHGSEQQCLVIQHEIAPKIEKLQDEIKGAITKISNTSVRFGVSTFAKEFNENVLSIGELKVDESNLKYKSGKLELFTKDFRNGEIKLIRTFNVAPSGETSGIFYNDLLIFTTYDTNKVIKYNPDGELLGELSVPNNPLDLCLLSNNRVVVSTHADVLFIVNSEDMTILKSMKLVDVPMYGVCTYGNNQLIVASGGNKNTLTWVDQSSGAKIKSVTTSGNSLFVSTSTNNDYLYGDKSNSACYVVNGTKKFTYIHDQLSTPFGNGIDDQGNFYIAGYNSRNIHQITDTGELVRIIPASTVGVENPFTVRFGQGTNKFLVTCGTSGKVSLCCFD